MKKAFTLLLILAMLLSALAGDTELLKLTHDEAKALMARPEDADARAVIALARERFADKLRDVAVN